MKFTSLALSAVAWRVADVNASCNMYSDSDPSKFPYNPFRCLLDDAIINGDAYLDSNGGFTLDWLPFGVGFEGINGIPGVDTITKEVADAYGGAYIDLPCGGVIAAPLTVSSVVNSAGFVVVEGDGFPLQFSWPVITSTIIKDWITVHMSDGSSFIPTAVTVTPAADYNEKNNIVIFDSRLLDRSRPTRDEINAGTGVGAYVDHVEITGPIMFAGPNGQVESAEGMVGYPTYDPYNENDGNRVVRAKMTVCDKNGDEGNWLWGASAPPNSCSDVYGVQDDMYRLRLFTQWGAFNPGRMPILPTDFETLFFLEATLADGSTMSLTETNVAYDLGVGVVTILGLAETGGNADYDPYDDCYYDDRDNIIDVVLVGDKAAVQLITKVKHDPTIEGYTPFFNPGAVGRDGGGSLRYTTGSVAHECEVSQNIDDPQQVNYSKKYGQGAYPFTVMINNLSPDFASSADNQPTLCSLLGGDIQAYTYALATPTTCVFNGNVVTVYVPALSMCDQEVIMGLAALADQLPLTNLNNNLGGTAAAVDPSVSFTPALVARNLLEEDSVQLDDAISNTLTELSEDSTFGPVDCSDGVTQGWVNMTAMNLALTITNYLCNIVDFEDACGPTFTVCPDTDIIDFTPIVVSQNDVTIECGPGGSGAGGCNMLSEYVASVAIRNNFLIAGLTNSTDEYADVIDGITIDGLTFTTAPGTFAGVIIAVSANENMDNSVTIKNSKFVDSESGDQSFGIFIADIDFNEGTGVVSDESTLFTGVKVDNCEFSGNTYMADIYYSGTGYLEVSNSYFGENSVTYNIGHNGGETVITNTCFVDNDGSSAVNTHAEEGEFDDNYSSGNAYLTCDGAYVEVESACHAAEATECSFVSSGGATSPTMAPTEAKKGKGKKGKKEKKAKKEKKEKKGKN